MLPLRSSKRAATRRSPHGERGLKFAGDVRGSLAWSRSPHGERGLKFAARGC